MTFVYVGIAIAVVIGLLIAFVASRPKHFTITREATISAPPAVVFGHFNDFHQWRAWSPWERMDPNLTRTYDGAAAGEGAKYAWSGNKQVGEGRMTIVESRPNELIRVKLEFLKPFKATNTAEFTFRPDGPGTRVTWSMHGERNFMFKAMCLLMDMDKMVGKDFERGLANLQEVVAGGTPAAAAAR
jgi:uncharacterized protein YndB with AHSA1/START domain